MNGEVGMNTETYNDNDKKNLVIGKLKQNGWRMDIPCKFLYQNVAKELFGSDQGSEVQGDHIASLLELDDRVRKQLAVKMTEALTKNRPFLILSGDGDNLKAANNIGRWLGDTDIHWSLHQMTTALEKAEFAAEARCKSFITRPEGGADEVSILMIFENEQDLKVAERVFDEELHKECKLEMNAEEERIVGFKSFNFSSSFSYADSTQEPLVKEINEVRAWIESHPGRPVLNLFKSFMIETDNIAHFYKAVKEILTLPNAKEWTNWDPNELIENLTIVFGGKRISPTAYRLQAQIHHLSGHINSLKKSLSLISGADIAEDAKTTLKRLFLGEVENVVKMIKANGLPGMKETFRSIYPETS